MFYYSQKKPYSAISVHVENLTSETYSEDDLAGVPDLLEVISLQATGAQEIARALRKKLKYGNVHRQLRALTILDAVLQNGNQRLQRTILDDQPLQERLRIAAVDSLSDHEVREKCKTLFGQWMASSQTQPGLAGAKALYGTLPRNKQPHTAQKRREQSKVLKETERDAFADPEDEDEPPVSRSRMGSVAEGSSVLRRRSSGAAPISLSQSSTFGTKKVKKDKKSKGKAFDLGKERPAVLQAIASSSVASTNLNNALKLINREHRRVSDDAEVNKRFETCKALRRQILRYIQFIETEELLGGLIDANERLIEALMAYEIMDKSVEDDSDSELEEAAHQSRQEKKRDDAAIHDAEQKFATLSVRAPPRPPRPQKATIPTQPARRAPIAKDDSDTESDDDDDDYPFADSNAAEPSARGGYTWKEV